MYLIIAIKDDGTVIEYNQLMRPFGDDLELAAEWCADINEPGMCPLEFTIAYKENNDETK